MNNALAADLNKRMDVGAVHCDREPQNGTKRGEEKALIQSRTYFRSRWHTGAYQYTFLLVKVLRSEKCGLGTNIHAFSSLYPCLRNISMEHLGKASE